MGQRVLGCRQEIPEARGLILGTTDGCETLTTSKLFSWIEPTLERLRSVGTPLPTQETHVSVFRMIRPATLVEIFGGIIKAKTLFTESQVARFVRDYPDELSTNGHGILIPFLATGWGAVVAYINRDVTGLLSVDTHRIGHDQVWIPGSFGHYRRVVLPR